MNDGLLARRGADFMRRWLAAFDPTLLATVAALATLGMLTLYSAGADFPWRFTDQLRNLSIAAAVML
ncbi:MAG: rod shape-determining protein RodA, partial [Betaproteobacteria bacterium]